MIIAEITKTILDKDWCIEAEDEKEAERLHQILLEAQQPFSWLSVYTLDCFTDFNGKSEPLGFIEVSEEETR